MLNLSVIATPRMVISRTRTIPGYSGGRSIIFARGSVKIISLVLPELSLRLQEADHSSIAESSAVVVWIFDAGMRRYVSSAYFMIRFRLCRAFRREMRLMKLEGPSPEPWMMLELIPANFESCPIYFVQCCESLKYASQGIKKMGIFAED